MGKKAMEAICQSQLKSPTVVSYKVGTKIYEVIIKPYLSFTELQQLVANTISFCYTDKEYHPQNKDFAWKYNVLASYTDIDFNRSSAEDAYKFITQTDIFERVSAKISDDLPSIFESINEKLKYKNQTRNSMSDLVEQFSKMSEEFEGIDAQEVLEVGKKLAEKDERTIVENIIDYEDKKHTKNKAKE